MYGWRRNSEGAFVSYEMSDLCHVQNRAFHSVVLCLHPMKVANPHYNGTRITAEHDSRGSPDNRATAYVTLNPDRNDFDWKHVPDLATPIFAASPRFPSAVYLESVLLYSLRIKKGQNRSTILPLSLRSSLPKTSLFRLRVFVPHDTFSKAYCRKYSHNNQIG